MSSPSPDWPKPLDSSSVYDFRTFGWGIMVSCDVCLAFFCRSCTSGKECDWIILAVHSGLHEMPQSVTQARSGTDECPKTPNSRGDGFFLKLASFCIAFR